MKKKFLSVATASVLAISMLAGCGGDDGSANNSSTPSSSTPSSAAADNSSTAPAEDSNLLPALSEAEQGKPSHLTTPRSSYVQYPYADGAGVTLSYWVSVPNNVQNNPDTADSVAGTQWAQLWEEYTGIDIEWEGPTSDTSTQFGLLRNMVKRPDIIEYEWTSSYTGGPAGAEADGMLIWLDDYITPDGPAADLWQYLQDNPTLDKAVKTDDGHYYCFPFTRGDAYLQTTSGPIVRQDVLEDLGFDLDKIETIDDWTDMLTKLKEAGFEKPLTTQNWSDFQTLFQAAYEFRPGMHINGDTGKVQFGGTLDGYKEFLKQARAWNEAGLVDADIIDNTSGIRQSNMLGGISAVTYGAGGGQIGTWNNTAASEPATYGETFKLTGIQFPVVNDGQIVRYSGGSTDYALTSQGHAVITADCENPEVAAAFLNWVYTKEGHEIINFGVEGEDYTKNADGTITYSDWIMSGGDGLGIAVAMANKGRANMSGAFVQDPNYIIAYWNTPEQQRAQHLWNDETDNQGTIMPAVTMTEEESSEYARLMVDINTEVGSYYDQAFDGVVDIDATWDEYVEKINGMGLDRAIEIQQAALDRYNSR